jgi:uncharacterized membrane protein YozB (DUF420 family)
MAPSGPSYASVAVFSTTIEGILYGEPYRPRVCLRQQRSYPLIMTGFSFLMFALTVWVIISKRGLSTWHQKAMFGAACLLLIISTIVSYIQKLFNSSSKSV